MKKDDDKVTAIIDKYMADNQDENPNLKKDTRSKKKQFTVDGTEETDPRKGVSYNIKRDLYSHNG